MAAIFNDLACFARAQSAFGPWSAARTLPAVFTTCSSFPKLPVRIASITASINAGGRPVRSATVPATLFETPFVRTAAAPSLSPPINLLAAALKTGSDAATTKIDSTSDMRKPRFCAAFSMASTGKSAMPSLLASAHSSLSPAGPLAASTATACKRSRSPVTSTLSTISTTSGDRPVVVSTPSKSSVSTSPWARAADALTSYGLPLIIASITLLKTGLSTAATKIAFKSPDRKPLVVSARRSMAAIFILGTLFAASHKAMPANTPVDCRAACSRASNPLQSVPPLRNNCINASTSGSVSGVAFMISAFIEPFASPSAFELSFALTASRICTKEGLATMHTIASGAMPYETHLALMPTTSMPAFFAIASAAAPAVLAANSVMVLPVLTVSRFTSALGSRAAMPTSFSRLAPSSLAQIHVSLSLGCTNTMPHLRLSLSRGCQVFCRATSSDFWPLSLAMSL